jgi:hypothetical protein
MPGGVVLANSGDFGPDSAKCVPPNIRCYSTAETDEAICLAAAESGPGEGTKTACR